MNRIKKLYDPLTSVRNPPVNLKEGQAALFGGPSYKYSLTDSYFVYFNDVLVTDIGIIFKSFKPLTPYINCYETDFKSQITKYVLKVLLRYKKIKSDPQKKYLLVFDNYSGPGGFFHWIADGLSRLVELKDIIHEYTILVPEYFQKEQLYVDTLSYFNIRESIIIPEKSCIKVDHLYVADYIAPSGNFNAQNVIKLRNFIWANCSVSKAKPTYSRLYISRKKAKRRFVENEDEVVEVMKSYGFQIVCLEDYSFKEQVHLAYSADYLVSIHGAALTHLFFMRPDTKVLEFRKENDSHNNLYFSLANEAGVHYYYQFCRATEISNAGNNFNLIVNLKELSKNLELMLA